MQKWINIENNAQINQWAGGPLIGRGKRYTYMEERVAEGSGKSNCYPAGGWRLKGYCAQCSPQPTRESWMTDVLPATAPFPPPPPQHNMTCAVCFPRKLASQQAPPSHIFKLPAKAPHHQLKLVLLEVGHEVDTSAKYIVLSMPVCKYTYVHASGILASPARKFGQYLKTFGPFYGFLKGNFLRVNLLNLEYYFSSPSWNFSARLARMCCQEMGTLAERHWESCWICCPFLRKCWQRLWWPIRYTV